MNIRRRFVTAMAAVFLAVLIGAVMTVPGPAMQAQAATKASVNKKNATVCVGKSVKLKVKNTDKKIKWKSGNKSIATVESTGKKTAKIVGKKTGTTIITAQVGAKKLKTSVTVKRKKTTDTDALKNYISENGKTDDEGYKYIGFDDEDSGLSWFITYNDDEETLQFDGNYYDDYETQYGPAYVWFETDRKMKEGCATVEFDLEDEESSNIFAVAEVDIRECNYDDGLDFEILGFDDDDYWDNLFDDDFDFFRFTKAKHYDRDYDWDYDWDYDDDDWDYDYWDDDDWYDDEVFDIGEYDSWSEMDEDELEYIADELTFIMLDSIDTFLDDELGTSLNKIGFYDY